jgi:hypothetical protein
MKNKAKKITDLDVNKLIKLSQCKKDRGNRIRLIL